MILLTGGAGFIGSVLLKELNKLGRHDILVVDRLRNSSKWLNLRGGQFAHYIYADELFLPENSTWLSKVRCIYHMGACSATTEMDMDYLMKNNVEYSKKLFRFAADRKIPMIYASSAATYGAGEQGYSDDESKISNLRPLNPYGYSKQLFDEWVLTQKKTPYVWFGVKFFNVYGPNEYHKLTMRSVVYKSFTEIRDQGKVQLFKSHRPDYQDGMQLRDFVYVKDIVAAMIALLSLNDPKTSGIYNLGTGKARSFNDLTIATFKAMGKEPRIEYVDMPEGIRNQYQYFTEAKMEKLSKVLPHFRFSSLEEGVSDYVKNYLLRDSIFH